MRAKNFETLIVGAGLAGLSTAYFLAKKSAGPVCLVETGREPGLEASAQNASMLCRLSEDAATSAMLAEGARILEEEWSRDLPCPKPRPSGSVFISGGCDGSDRLEAMSIAGAKAGVTSDLLSRDEALRLFPFLKDSPFDAALYCNADGVLDVKALVAALAAAVRKAGGEIATASRASLRRTPQGFETDAASGTVRAPRCVNAAGAWAGEVAASVGAQSFEIKPLKRHIFVTSELKAASPEWPIVWDVTRKVYFRMEGKKLLLSPCDEEPSAAGPAPVNPAAEKAARDKLAAFFPAAAKLPFETAWAGLRTFAPDRRFVVGPDAEVPGFFWAACLGGHGVTASASVGKISAAFITGTTVNPALVRAFSPARFA